MNASHLGRREGSLSWPGAGCTQGPHLSLFAVPPASPSHPPTSCFCEFSTSMPAHVPALGLCFTASLPEGHHSFLFAKASSPSLWGSTLRATSSRSLP